MVWGDKNQVNLSCSLWVGSCIVIYIRELSNLILAPQEWGPNTSGCGIVRRSGRKTLTQGTGRRSSQSYRGNSREENSRRRAPGRWCWLSTRGEAPTSEILAWCRYCGRLYTASSITGYCLPYSYMTLCMNFLQGEERGPTPPEANLLHQLISIRETVLHVILFDLRNS